MTIKLIILAIVFVLSGGAAFSEYFRGHKKLSFLATVIAIIATFYLFEDIWEDIEEKISKTNESTVTQSSVPNPPVITEVTIPDLLTQSIVKPEIKPSSLADNLIENPNFTAYFQPKKGQFETTSAFQTRWHKLLQQFNNQVQQRNLAYQVGTLKLKNYDADTQKFTVNLNWQANWLNQFETLQNKGIVTITVQKAKQLYNAGNKKPLFIIASLHDNQVEIQGLIVENGQTYPINLVKLPKMVKIPAGKFQMGDIQGGGDSDEKPVHWVTIKQPFFMSKYEITFAEYDAFAEATSKEKPDDKGWGRANRPVINVSWDDAVAYTTWLSQQTGDQYRLPSEAEWEYAARAGTKTKYWWGNNIGKNKANCSDCGDKFEYTSPVGSFQPNKFGLYDTVGNVWEWCADYYQNSYKNAPTDGSVWKKDSKYRVLRGGSWDDDPNNVRSANRFRSNYRFYNIGFRVVR